MNKQRRQRISAVCDKLEELTEEVTLLHDEEREAFDNMPEALQGSQKGQESEEAFDALYDAELHLMEAMDYLLEQRA